MTSVSNASIYQGWHDWHTDGPSRVGRYHKVFIMVDKDEAEANRPRTNVQLVPSDALYAHAQCFDAFANDATAIDQHMFNQSWTRRGHGGGVNYAKTDMLARAQKLHAWGMNDVRHSVGNPFFHSPRPRTPALIAWPSIDALQFGYTGMAWVRAAGLFHPHRAWRLALLP